MSYFQYQGNDCFYEEAGQGAPLVFLHGNTASSKMFEAVKPLYTPHYRCIFIDFIGHGKSDRVPQFSPDLWQEEALQVIALLEHLDCGKANLIGASGGAWVAVNAGLDRPDLVNAILADSFDGRTLNESFADNLISGREKSKQDRLGRAFYIQCQGDDWETVVNLDTRAMLQCFHEKRPLFCKDLGALNVPVLFTGSREDEMCRHNLEEEYTQMAAVIPNARVHMFRHGGHPALVTNAVEFADLAHDFFRAIHKK